MKKKLLAALAWVLLAGVAIVFPLSSVHALSVWKYETETRIYDPEKIYDGYLLLNNGSGGGGFSTSQRAYLLDPMGRICHTWTGVGNVSRLYEDGLHWGMCNLKDWEGNTVWQKTSVPNWDGEAYSVHHDGRRIWNQKLQEWTYLLVANHDPDSQTFDDAGWTGSNQANIDTAIEINEAGEIIWMWRFIDHTFQTEDSNLPRYLDPDDPDFAEKAAKGFDVNWMTDDGASSQTDGIRGDWMHVNAVDYDEDKDIVVLDPKHWSQQVFIDHGATFVPNDPDTSVANAARNQFSQDKIDNPELPDGDLIYRWGNPSSYLQNLPTSSPYYVEPPGFNYDGKQQEFGPHCVSLIPTYAWREYHATTNTDQQVYSEAWDNPTSAELQDNAGGFLMYDNGCYRPTGFRSIVHEVNPFINADGVDTCPDRLNRATCDYVPEYIAGWEPISDGVEKSKQEIWQFQSKLGSSFYSSHISGTWRLANGNTLCTAGNRAHFFQVTKEGEVVWEYAYAPATGNRLVTDSLGSNIFRTYWYGTEFPTIAAHLTDGTLDPAATIAGRSVEDMAWGESTYNYKIVGSTPAGDEGCAAADTCCAGCSCPGEGDEDYCHSCCETDDYAECGDCPDCDSCGCEEADCDIWCATQPTDCEVCCAGVTIDYTLCEPCPECPAACSTCDCQTLTCPEWCLANDYPDCPDCCEGGTPPTCAECCDPTCPDCCPGCDSIDCTGECPTCESLCNGCQDVQPDCSLDGECCGTFLCPSLCAEDDPACCPYEASGMSYEEWCQSGCWCDTDDDDPNICKDIVSAAECPSQCVCCQTCNPEDCPVCDGGESGGGDGGGGGGDGGY
jgi:hypothetical protein